MRIVSIVLCITPVLLMCGEWTRTYRYEMHGNGSNRAYTCKNMHTFPFTQLICSWNALRPEHGYFSLWGRVRDVRTKQWSLWHHLHDWGAQIQRSHYSVGEIATNYYVRLEPERQADAFEIRVVPHDGADIVNMHRVFVNISRRERMEPEAAMTYSAYTSINPIEISYISQKALGDPDAHHICSPVSMSMILNYIGESHVSPIAFARRGYDHGLGAYGSWPYTVAAAYTVLPPGYGVCVQRLVSFGYVLWYLERGLPVVISVRGDIQDAPQSYPNGHLLVINGFDSHELLVSCADPAMLSDDRVHVWYQLSDVLAAWERSYRLAYTIQPYIFV